LNQIEQLVAQVDREVERTRRAIECVPEGRDDWKPHDKSMPLGRLATMVAGMPGWLAMMVCDDELDLSPPGGGKMNLAAPATRADRLKALDDGAAQARAALRGTTEEHLLKPWRLLVAGKVVSEHPRHIVLSDTFMHLAHHRGQLTVYLRLLEAKVPAVYGPSADENRFD